eukprot:CAMPEP_0119354182 /NCGR_PEP_ID=MMETSP1334-20130426/3213_1 /TAXON_ID=127549 /ORGANISM="Calcidiscus leptoporus, Strain RCC1130" /LENGTH=613 /DNA_ID=CAMNT_0007367667 /DNA_START=39 /DNA_END=1880 /DNA_ORIENTATION=-
MKRIRDDDEGDGEEGEEGAVAPAGESSRATGERAAALSGVREALSALPSADMYEKSYMHRDTVTHVVVTPSDFIISASRDGQLKFWKKMQSGIEFIKHFKAHLTQFTGLACSADGSLLASTAADKALKVFDVLSFDMINWLKLEYTPGVCEWVSGSKAARATLAIADADAPQIRMYDAASAEGAVLYSVNVHSAPVLVMKLNAKFDAVVSADARGVIEYWRPDGEPGLPKGATFRYKTETDLYAVAKCKARPTSLSVSADGRHFALTATDLKIRIYSFRSGKTRRTYDEGLDALHTLQKTGDDAYRLEAFDFGRRMAVEREYRAAAGAPASNVAFDETGAFVIFASVVGIKVIALETSTLVRLLGKVENTERFTHVALFQGRAKLSATMIGSGGKVTLDEDPTLLCCAFKKSRFFLFSSREPQEPEGDEAVGRDVFNEKPSKEDLQLAQREAKGPLPKMACINTSYGEVHVKLFPDECPKTVENFTTHARNGYYDGVLFHRVIKGFMVQTGDPLGDGTGGTSIWGHEFEDEFHRSLRHDRPYTLSMANAGPNTNGSQFFVTTAPTTWLDNKHTVFGRVVQGTDVVQGIEKVKTDKQDKPIADIKIISIVCMES